MLFPKWIVFQLLEKCNLRCKMCYEWGTNGQYKENTTNHELDFNLIKQIVESCAASKPHYDLFGGEPLLYKNLDKVIELIKKNKSPLEIVSNGLLIHKWIDGLIANKVDKLWVSVDGPEKINDLQRGKNVFRNLIHNVQLLSDEKVKQKSRYPELGISFIITPLNYHSVFETFSKSVDVTQFSFVYLELQKFILPDVNTEFKKFLKSNGFKTNYCCSDGYVNNIEYFSSIDIELLNSELIKTRKWCEEKGIKVFTNPDKLDKEKLKLFFTGRMVESGSYPTSCMYPFFFAEISAAGNLTTCHTFYEISLGNVYENNFLELWRGNRINHLRNITRKNLLPICIACCNNYNNYNIYK